MDGVTAQLQTNLKTHKPPGQAKPRAIHSVTKNPLVHFGEYVAWKLRKVLSRERHILNSVEEFRELRSWSLTRKTGSSLQMSKTSLWWVITGTWRKWLHQSWNRRRGI